EAALLLPRRLLRYELQRALCESHLLASLGGETVAAGVLTCLLVYPLYLLVFALFRMSRSKVDPERTTTGTNLVVTNLSAFCVCVCVCGRQCVSVEQVPPQVDQESVEIDDFLDNSMGGTSFLFYGE
ncbi:unnamed protein product, partial [Tetraodon nigroviridis]